MTKEKTPITLGRWTKLDPGESSLLEVWEISKEAQGERGILRIFLVSKPGGGAEWKTKEIGTPTVTPDDMRHAGIIMGRQQVREIVNAGADALAAGIDAFRRKIEASLDTDTIAKSVASHVRKGQERA